MAALLAFDTSTERLAVALVAGGRARLHEGEGGAKASQALIPAALALLADAGLAPGGLDAIAFGRGPGAFTGLRTACAVAQGLAFGAGRPVLALDSLALVAEDARAQLGARLPPTLWVAMDARMGEVYAARYACAADGRWPALDAPALWTLEALAARWRAEPPEAVAGSALDAFGERLPLAPGAPALPAERSRAAALAALAEAAWRDGPRLAPAEALPLYLRDKVALTTAEREAARVAAAP